MDMSHARLTGVPDPDLGHRRLRDQQIRRLQRISHAPILILDEATSALDSEAEAAIHDTLGEVMTGRTVIAIAHRLSTIAHLDRIVVLNTGRIAEQGTHAELLERGGIYSDLWSRQSGGFLGTTVGQDRAHAPVPAGAPGAAAPDTQEDAGRRANRG